MSSRGLPCVVPRFSFDSSPSCPLEGVFGYEPRDPAHSLAISLLYEFFILFLLCLTTDNARQFLKFFDPSLGTFCPSSSFLGVPLHDRDYANDCRIYTPDLDHPFKNVRDIIFDEFFLSHLLGWVAKVFPICQ